MPEKHLITGDDKIPRRAENHSRVRIGIRRKDILDAALYRLQTILKRGSAPRIEEFRTFDRNGKNAGNPNHVDIRSQSEISPPP